jgi:hypothetical protein
MRITHRAAAITAAAAFGAAVAAAPGASAATPTAKVTVGPAGVRFYTPPRRLPADRMARSSGRGRCTASRRCATNTLVLYTQVGVRGRLVAVSGIVSVPKGRAPKRGWPVLTYAHGTTGIADACAPSRDTGPASGADAADLSIVPLLDR